MKKDFKAYANSCITMRNGTVIYAIESVKDIVFQMASDEKVIKVRSSGYHSKEIIIPKFSITNYRNI